MCNTFLDCTILLIIFATNALQIKVFFSSLMYDIFHHWTMDAFKLRYFNSRLISFVY